MGPIFRLSLRQLLGKWRIAIIVLLAAAPVGLVAVIRAFNADMGRTNSTNSPWGFLAS